MSRSDYVPFDRDWCAIGFIEPDFVTETYGWANEEILYEAGMLPVRNGCGEIVCWVPDAFVARPLPEPKRLTRTTLRWRWVGHLNRERLAA